MCGWQCTLNWSACFCTRWHCRLCNNNNNKTFKSQTSWGRLELKPSRSNQGSSMWIVVFQALLSKAKSLGIFHPFKSPFIASTQVNFGLPLLLFTLLSWLRIPLRTGASGGLRWTCPNHLNLTCKGKCYIIAVHPILGMQHRYILPSSGQLGSPKRKAS